MDVLYIQRSVFDHRCTRKTFIYLLDCPEEKVVKYRDSRQGGNIQ